MCRLYRSHWSKYTTINLVRGQNVSSLKFRSPLNLGVSILRFAKKGTPDLPKITYYYKSKIDTLGP